MSASVTQISETFPATFSTLADALRAHVQERPRKIAYRFLKDGEVEERSFTYRELDHAARSVAALLQERSSAGDRILLLFPPGLDFIVALCGCFYAGRVAVPAYPPRPNRSLGRLLSIIEDARPSLALTHESQSRVLQRVVGEPAFQELPILSIDAGPTDSRRAFHEIDIDPGSLALLQYTSGSTSTPKGVQITHANLVHNEGLIQKAFGQTENDIIVGWLPVYHDMGLIGTVLQPLYTGAESILMSPVAFLQNPVRWLAAISRYGATTSGGPNFAYELCCNRITAEQKSRLDLSSWRVAFNGAEPVRAHSLERFAAGFYDCGFRASAFAPCYGLAESTLFVSGGATVGGTGPVVQAVQAAALERDQVIPASGADNDSRRLVGCGHAPAGTVIAIVDPEQRVRRRPGSVGEIWISGASVAIGYWNRPEETSATFEARLADSGEGPFLRTGDLGFVRDGELFITGRSKDLIIIRGRNHYPHDLELTVEQSHPALRACIGAAFSVEFEGEERLVIVHEINRRGGADFDEVFAAIRQAVAEEHELQVEAIVLARPGEVPKTSSGKVQRYLCRQAFLNRTLEYFAEWRAGHAVSAEQPGAEVEAQDWQQWLIQQIAHRLRLAPEEIDADQPPSRYGLDSLAAVELVHEVEKSAGTALPLADLLSGLSIAELAVAIGWHKEMAAAGVAPAAIHHRPQDGPYPLAHGQRALFYLYQVDRQNAAYHIHQAARIPHQVDADALSSAFRSLVQRHAALRTVFSMRDGQPAQQVTSEVIPILEQRSCDQTHEELLGQMAAEARHPFDLEAAPPVRCILFSSSQAESYLLFVIHHIVSDFWSLSLLVHELSALYDAEASKSTLSLPMPELEYSDFVRWQADVLAGAQGARHWEYWQRELAGELPVLHLPADHPRPAVQTFHGAAYQVRLAAGLRDQLRALAVGHGATLYTVLLSGWLALLHRYTGQSEALVGSPAAGRTHAAFRSVAGYFVNPVVIRARFDGDPAFSNFLAHVRGKVLDALAHQDFPFPLLVEKLQPQRDPSRSPLFQLLFVMQGELGGSPLGLFALGESGGVLKTRSLTLESLSLPEEVSQFDIAVQACESQDEIVIRFQYNTDLFEQQTIARMAAHLQTLLEGSASSALRLSELPLLSAEERRMLESWNVTSAIYPHNRPLHEIIEAQAERTPNAPAVRFEQRSLSYAELNCKANQVAHRLRSHGVGPESLVGVCMERSFALVAGLLGILKAGAAYVPFDPSYPPERLKFLVQDAGVPVLLLQDSLAIDFATSQMLTISVDAECSSLGNDSHDNSGVPVSLDNLAYMIYTSGSTGNPKGAMNSHRAICNRLEWMQARYQLTADDRVLQKTPFSFDVSVWEFFWPLMTGASLVLARPEGHRDSQYLRNLIIENKITTIHFVPSMLAAFLDEPGIESCVSLRRVIASGEALPRSLVRRFYSRLNTELHNLYGPTEAAVDVTSFACSRDDKHASVPIGTPIANVQTYVLDSHLELSPIGVVGELYIGGVGVGRGYHRRPELTAEKFIADPFSSEPGARMYKTGDLVRYLPDQNIEFLGRNDHQVKVRGFRIELGEIEAALARHPSVAQAVVIVRGASGGSRRPENYRVALQQKESEISEFRGFLKAGATKEAGREAHASGAGESANARLVAYIVCAGAQPAVNEFRQFLKQSLPVYMVPADFVFLPSLPLSPNGKLDRQALPEPHLDHRFEQAEYVAPEGPTETLLAQIWSEVLGIEKISPLENFFELGGDSIRSLQVRARALQRGLNFTLQNMMRYQTIRELAQHVAATSVEERQPLAPFALVSEQDRLKMPADAEDAYPLSKVQAGLIYHLQYDPNSAIYHDIFFYQVRAHLDFDLFRQAAQESVNRHPILRTSFHMSDFSEPLQVVHRHVAARVELFDWRLLPAAERQQRIREWTETEKHFPLQLLDHSLIRLFVHRLEDDVFQIVSSYYGIMLDGWSEASLITGLLQRYSALLRDPSSPALPGPQIKYRDFVALERSAMASKETQAYWERGLDGCVVHSLPRWAGQGAMDASQVRSLDVAIPADVLQALDSLARQAGTAPKHVFLAGHIKVMSLLAGGSDLVIGFQTFGRLEELDGDQVLGMHNNTLPMRVRLANCPWIDLVRQAFVAERDLLPHRRYPLVELQKARGRQQLFETVFNHTHFHVFQGLEKIPGIEVLGSWGIERSHYTLRAEFNRNPFTGQMQLDLNCDISQIGMEQMQQIASCYSRVFRAMAEQPFSMHDAQEFFSPIEIAAWSQNGSPKHAHTLSIQPTLDPSYTPFEEPASLETVASTPIQEMMASMWCQVLNRERIGQDENFFQTGGDSLLATQLMLYLRARLKIELPLRVLFEEAPTLGAFARKVEEALRAGASQSRPPLERVQRGQAPPLSFAQRRLWFLEHLEPTVYNTPAAVRVAGRLDRTALQRSLNEIVRRHETLRTTFEMIDRLPVQRIAASLEIEIPLVDLSTAPSAKKEKELELFIRTEVRRPFNLETGPLLRAYLVRLNEHEHVLFAILHHIISDGWSVGLFITEMVPLYEAFLAGDPSPLPELPVQYADFAAWQNSWLQGVLLEQQIAYWSNKLKGPLPNLDLPPDFPRPDEMQGDGGLVAVSIPVELVQQLRLLGNREGCTMFMTLLGAFYVMMHYHLGQPDLVVGTDLANRSAAETEKLIGFFVNQVALRTDLSGDPAFSEILARVRTIALEAYLHQDVPFDRVVEAVNPPRMRNRSPLFQVKFVLQNAPRPRLEMAGLHLSELELNSGTAKFDLLVNVFEQEGVLRMMWEYSTEIFRESSIKRMAECFLALAHNVAANPEQKLHESVELLRETETRLRQGEEQKRQHSLREKLVQKSRKVTM